MKYIVSRKEKKVTFRLGNTKEVKTFEETWAFIYLLMRKMASSHRA